MKIKRIEIENFGKLHKYKLDLSPGINLIYGNNEDGKSTLMAFVKMMFYSEQKRTKDISNNPRKKYMPWNGQVMGGAIEFESNGIQYRIEKEMGTTPAKDKVKIINLQTGVPVLQTKEELGKIFFGTDLAGFERSIFIGQIGAFGADKEDEIAQKLSNMFSTGEENISQKQVEERIGKAKEEMKSLRGNKGSLVEAKELLEKLKEEKSKIKELEVLQEEFLQEIELKKNQLLAKKTQKKKIENKIKAETLKNLQQKLQTLIQKVEQEQELRNKIEEGNVQFEEIEDFLKESRKLLSDLKSQEATISRFMDSITLSNNGVEEIKEEEYKQYQKMVEELNRAESCYEHFKKNLIPAIDDFIQAREQLKEQRKEQFLKEKISKKLKKDRLIFFIEIGISIVVLVAGIMLNPIVLVLGICMGLFSLLVYQRNIKSVTNINNEKHDFEVKEDDPLIQNLEKGILHQIQYFKEQFFIHYSLNQDASEFVSDLEKNKMKLEEQLDLFIKQKKCQTKEDLEALYLKNISLQNNKLTLDTMKKEYQGESKRLIEHVGKYKGVDTLEAAIAQLESVEQLFETYKIKKQDVMHMASALDMSSVKLESLKEESEKIRSQMEQLGEVYYEEMSNVSNETIESLPHIEEEVGKLEEEIQQLREKIRTPEKNLSQIEVEQRQLEEKVDELQFYYDSLAMAEGVLKEAGEEVRQSFGPELNQKTGEIFNQLTGGSYKQVIVAKDYSLLAQSAEDTHYREASYLSNGTIDQAYLALRLAITQLIMKDTENLPLFLDDIFMQYDDNRVNDGFTFLKDFFAVDKMQSQVILLTCHSYIRDFAIEKLGDGVAITTL